MSNNTKLNTTITFIGGGNMASSLIGGMIREGYQAQNITVSDPNIEGLNKLKQQFGINTDSNNNQAITVSDIIILAVKPQIMAKVCEGMASAITNWNEKLVISIAAGVSVTRLQGILGKETPIVRTMPNTPALLQQGMTGLYACEQVSVQQKTQAGNLLNAVGKTCWVNQESDINIVTAASGSGPAYFFLFMEAMQQSAMKMGFDEDQAKLLVQQTALGAAEMVIQNPELSLETLRHNVTSKGGTTAQAIESFEQQGLRDVVNNAMLAAAKRGAEMEKIF